MINIEAGAVKGAICRHCRKDFSDGLHTAFGHLFGRFNNQGHTTQADEHPVAAAVKWQGDFFDHIFGGRCAAGEKSSAKPAERIVGGNIVSRDNNHALTTPGEDPVLRQTEGLRRAGTGRIDLGVCAT